MPRTFPRLGNHGQGKEFLHSLLELSNPSSSSEAASTSRSTKSSDNKKASTHTLSSYHESSSLVPSFCRRGLVNRQNTCFYNCIFQSLLACEEFWTCCSHLSNILSEVDPKLKSIDQASDIADASNVNGKNNSLEQFHIQVHHSSNETNGTATDLDRSIPIIHELLLFAAHFRARSKKQPTPSPSSATDLTLAASPSTTTEGFGPSSATRQSSNGVESRVDETPQASPVSTDNTLIPPPQQLLQSTDDSAIVDDGSAVSTPASAPTPASSSNAASAATKAKRKKKKGGQDDDAFLDSIIASTSTTSTPAAATTAAEVDADEEERRKAKNRKKKEKEREKAAKQKEEQRLQQQKQQEEEQKQKEQAQQPEATEQIAEEVKSLSIEGDVSAAENAPMNKRARRAAAKAAAAAAAGTTVDSVDAEAEATASPSSATGATTTAVPSTKQHRVHRVEDEEQFIVPVTTNGKSKGKGADKQQQQQKLKPPPSALSTSTPSASPSASSTTAPTSFVPSLGKPIDSHSFLPSFPRLLKNFRSYRQGQQEDAQEFLQVLLENLQREWTQFISPLKQMYGIESSSNEASAANTEFQSATDDWNEVGRGSRAIKVVSNIAFQPSPFSRLFSGRIRSQLTVASRANDTMSFQPFFALHLDIDEQQVVFEEDKSQLTAAQKKHRKRKEKGMSVEKALERYMCPSEIEGYRKRNAASVGYDAYGNPVPATTRALHMHALDSHCLPRILVLHLKRFEQHDAYSTNSRNVAAAAASLHKNSKFVSFSSSLQLPARYLSTASSLAGSNAVSGVEYSLAAIVVHLGHSMSNGHYVSYVRDRSQEGQKSTPAASPAAPTSSSSSSSKQNNKKSNSASSTPSSAKVKKPVLKSSFEVDDSDDDEENEEEEGSGSSKSNAETEAKARAIDREIWYQCDDTRITPVPAHSVYAQTAYLLFYTLEDK